jgi:hypothetical protein
VNLVSVEFYCLKYNHKNKIRCTGSEWKQYMPNRAAICSGLFQEYTCYSCTHPFSFYGCTLLSLFYHTITPLQILHFASVFKAKGVVFCFIMILPPVKVFLDLRYKMLVPQANLKQGFITFTHSFHEA